MDESATQSAVILTEAGLGAVEGAVYKAAPVPVAAIVPTVEFQSESNVKPDYGFANTSAELDKAFKQFYGLMDLIADLARAEGTTFQITNDVGRTQRRVNALNHVLIPLYRHVTKRIELVLEEKEREEFVRTKLIKHMIKEHE